MSHMHPATSRMMRGRLIVACVAALAQVTLGRRTCNTAQYGLTRGHEVHLPEQYMTHAVPDWKINVPVTCARPVGVKVAACDADSAPAVHVDSLARGVVRRTGRLATGAYIYVTVYCDVHRPTYYADTTSATFDQLTDCPAIDINEEDESSKFWAERLYGRPRPTPPVMCRSPSPPGLDRLASSESAETSTSETYNSSDENVSSEIGTEFNNSTEYTDIQVPELEHEHQGYARPSKHISTSDLASSQKVALWWLKNAHKLLHSRRSAEGAAPTHYLNVKFKGG